MNKPSSRTTAFVAVLAMAVTACVAPTSARESSTDPVGSTSAALEGGPASIPFPVATAGNEIQYDPGTGLPLPRWSGTIVDLMAADAWAQCGAHVVGVDENSMTVAGEATDSYQLYLEAQITQSACPNTFSDPLPESSFTITNCSSSVSCLSAIKRWARQRQLAACNVDASTGLPSIVRFHPNNAPGQFHTLNASSFALGAPTDVRDGLVAYAQKIIDVGEVNLCMAQRLREHVASADSLFLKGDDLRQLLEVIRERAQLAMIQYALLARVFSTGPGASGVSTSQGLLPLTYWPTFGEAQTPLREMGDDLATAVQLHIDTTRELAELLARSASARGSRGGTSTGNAQQDFGPGGTCQRI